MNDSQPRPRSSTTASRSCTPNDSSALELRDLIANISNAITHLAQPPTPELLHAISTLFHRVRQLLIDALQPGQLKDAFRHFGGFSVVLQSIRSVSGFYDPYKQAAQARAEFFEIVKATLDVLSEALNEHTGNRRYFAKRVEGGGWSALEQALASTGIGSCQPEDPSHDAAQEQFFGYLFAFALGEESMARTFRDISNSWIDISTDDTGVPAHQLAKALVFTDLPPIQPGDDETQSIGLIKQHLEGMFDGHEFLQNAEVIPIIFTFWLLSRQAHGPEPHPLSVSVLLAIEKVIAISTCNGAAVHSTRLLSTILPVIFGDHAILTLEKAILRRCAAMLVKFGINNLQDIQFLIQRAAVSEDAAEFLLEGLITSRSPPFIQFDLSLLGYSSIELRDIGHTFPPQSPSSGYSLAAWIRVDKYDSQCHTTIFGACDASQSCFVLAYIEKDTHNFILQTSVTSSRPSVRFKSTVFEEGIWYHLAVVHRRPKAAGPSKAFLFVNGNFAEQVKCNYPSSPSLLNASTDSFTSLSAAQRSASVQAFLGTPQDLAPRLGRNVTWSCLSVASLHLFAEALSDEMVAVQQKLGPRYCGNYQDCLGSFQTYRASAELNLYNELLHPGKEEKSEIVAAVRMKAGNVLPESRILLSISPCSVMDDDFYYSDEPQFAKSLSRIATRNLHAYTRTGGNPIAINGAIPSINNALTQDKGVALLLGRPTVVVPQSLDDALWRIGGCAAVGLRLVELADSRDSVLRAVNILLQSIEGSWRNSEAMEKENGFGVLGGLLREKLGYGPTIAGLRKSMTATDSAEREALSLDLLKMILRFVGYDETNPTESLIINPLAYRVLLVDLDVWRRAAAVTQKLYYQQIIHFASGSKHHHFNIKRLNRMRIVKRYIEALKGEPFAADVFPFFLEAFKILVTVNMSGDNHRALALFITYALQDGRTNAKNAIYPRMSMMSLRNRSDSGSNTQLDQRPRTRGSTMDGTAVQMLSRAQIGVRVLSMYAELLCDRASLADLKKFARTVTNKWLLYLLAESDPRAVVLGAKILARLLVVHGSNYVRKFAEKNGGFKILRGRLKHWWHQPAIWTICFAILFDKDISTIDLERTFDLPTLIKTFADLELAQVTYPEALTVIMAMLKVGLKATTDDKGNTTKGRAPSQAEANGRPEPPSPCLDRSRQEPIGNLETEDNPELSASTLETVIRFLAILHKRSRSFRDFATSSNFVQELLFVLYPVIVTSDHVSAETELLSRGSALTFEGQDVVIRPEASCANSNTHIVRTTTVKAPLDTQSHRAAPLRRGSSFVLISADKAKSPLSIRRPNHVLQSNGTACEAVTTGNSIIEALVEVVLAVLLDQLLHKKEFTGFGLFLKVPPGFQEHQAYFQSYILVRVMTAVSNTLQLDQKLLCEPKVLTNVARYTLHMLEAVFEGWFLNGGEPLLEFTGMILDYLQKPEISRIKSVRLCSQATHSIRQVFLKVVLLQLSNLDGAAEPVDTVAFLRRLIYWQTILLSPENGDEHFLKLICYLLYMKLLCTDLHVRQAAAELWRLLLVQKPTETSKIIGHALVGEQKDISLGFLRLTELDNEAFLYWVDAHVGELDVFFRVLSKAWEEFVAEQNREVEKSARHRIEKRREKLKQWQAEESSMDNLWHRHEISTSHWRSNIHASEHLKHQRALQDQQDSISFMISTIQKLHKVLKSPCGLFGTDQPDRWCLDETEGRNRMRMRILPDDAPRQEDYRPKRDDSEASKNKLHVQTMVAKVTSKDVSATPIEGDISEDCVSNAQEQSRFRSNSQLSVQSAAEDDFEMVEGPNVDEDGFEDKNRKVMRSLQLGDQVQHVFNVSRIIGLEAIEGLLILGTDWLYLLDYFFQRSDGEIVRVWQAPAEERDAYLQMISGHQTDSSQKPHMVDTAKSTRNWKWEDVISISKRRFLFRDVAIEIFFTDGRSYLLTALKPSIRNDLYSKLVAKAPHVNNPQSVLQTENAWRLESLRNPDEGPQTFGSKWANVFNAGASNPATKKWLKGEISNFHYLMLINTLAGRTFNDLTQYPVFPWVLADYTSEELDLTDPHTFRDLSKPMGGQTPSREAEFRERYQSFAEMGDHNAPPFHYGTHYSSAMIVTSYLIRLQPFVQSYLLLQGGNFDHADRLFYSIEKAWLSASRDNMTDVRELTPEFFYLPEFLVNLNGYNFGTKQNTGEKIDDVILPPWAKGDPEIFVFKHREALESPFVTNNLHKWIDLVFGYKQRGEAAVEATNVFHHLSYHGAKDLDLIEDPVERLATIGIIHNFGQTPHQIFQRAHPQRDSLNTGKRLETAESSLARHPFPVSETQERITSLLYSAKQDRVLCSGALRLDIPPLYERYMEWGFVDGSVRFYAADSRKTIGLFEHLHVGQLSAAVFADSATLVTAGTDCTLSLWTLATSSGSKDTFIDLQPRVTLFGHHQPVITLAASKAWATFLSADNEGRVFLWDLVRGGFVRELLRPTGKRPHAATAEGSRLGRVQAARINNVTGRIVVCEGPRVLIFTLNGRLLVEKDLSCEEGVKDGGDIVESCAWYEGSGGNEWLEKELLLTGHRGGVVNIWHLRPAQSHNTDSSIRKGSDEGYPYELALLNRLEHCSETQSSGLALAPSRLLSHATMRRVPHGKQTSGAAITCILPMPQAIYTGDEDGKVWQWTLI